MSYKITTYTKNQAKKLGVIVKPSKLKGKKIDVFKYILGKDKKKELKKIASVGAIGYGDYPTFMATRGKEYANTRRKAYKARHQKTRVIVGSRSYWADNLLW